MEDASLSNKIRLIAMNGSAYVWNSEDWSNLRKYRILGNFIGNLAALPRQDQIAGFPFALLKEEVKLLLEKDYATIKVIPNISNPPSEDIQAKSNVHRKAVLSEQVEILKNKRKQEIEENIDTIIKGKAKKKYLDKTGKGYLEFDTKSILEEEFNKIQTPKETSLAIQIFTEDPWTQDKDYEDCIWNYPETDKEKLNYLVFKNLWERGYYITPGQKFGGDYLAYPGDPVKFHAFFVVICTEKNKNLGVSDVITYGRLAHSVRKTVVLAFLANDEICYQSLQWAGF